MVVYFGWFRWERVFFVQKVPKIGDKRRVLYLVKEGFWEVFDFECASVQVCAKGYCTKKE